MDGAGEEVEETVEQLRQRNAALEARVLDLRQALRRAEALTQLAAGAVHDIRNALTVILGEIDDWERDEADPGHRESSQIVVEAARHAAALARDVLRTGLSQEGDVLPAPGGELLAAARPLLESALQPISDVRIDCASGVWSVRVERERLQAALVNLCSNARDALGAAGSVRVSAFNVPAGAPLPAELPAGEYVGFRVEDSGPGMSPDVLLRATDAFFTTKGPESGTGLGLSMVKAFCLRSGGALQIDSRPGAGTRVDVLLPRAVERAFLGTEDPRRATVDTVLGRIRTPWLRSLLEAWRASCPTQGLPTTVELEVALIGHEQNSLVVATQPARPDQVRLVRLGAALEKAIRRCAPGEASPPGAGWFAQVSGDYRAALRSRCPQYTFASYAFGAGPPAQFERVLLPAAADGVNASHVIGAVAMSDHLLEGEP